MRLAYADPPYVGQSKKHYENHPDYAGEVDHAALIKELQGYDGWALSCHVNSLLQLWPLCPTARVGAWVKPFAFFKPGVKPAYAWEPVLFKSARTERDRAAYWGKKVVFCRDWGEEDTAYRGNVWGVTPAERKEPVKGKKRDEFCYWVFGLLGALPTDEFTDFFPGSGGVGRAWEFWVQQDGLLVPGMAPRAVDPVNGG